MAQCGKGWANRCADAKPGTPCRCSCGGANHGIAFANVGAPAALHKVAISDRAQWKVSGKTNGIYVLRDMGGETDLPIADDMPRIVKQLKGVLGGRRLFFRDQADDVYEVILEKKRIVRIERAPDDIVEQLQAAA